MDAFYVYVCICIHVCVLMNSYKQWVSAKQITLNRTMYLAMLALCFLKIRFGSVCV